MHTTLKAGFFGFTALAALASAGPAPAQVISSGDIAKIETGAPIGGGIFAAVKSMGLVNPLAGELCIGAVTSTCANSAPTAPVPGFGTVSVSGAGNVLTVNKHTGPVCSVDDTSACGSGHLPFSGARIFVGVSETGTLNVTAGGQLVINGSTSPDGGVLSVSDRVGGNEHGASADGTVNVDGAGSKITVMPTTGGAAVTIGRDGTGYLNVTNGGAVETQGASNAINIGGTTVGMGTATETGFGIANVTNAGSQLMAGALFVGRSTLGNGNLTLDDLATATGSNVVGVGYEGGTGVAEVKSGAQLSSSAAVFVGRFTGSNGTLTVKDGGIANVGTGSILAVASEGGNGALNMSNGGVINGTNTTVFVGRSQDAGLTGGVGTADVQNSTINARSLIVGHDAGSNGTMTIGGTTAISLTDASTTGASLLVGRDGTGVVNMTGGQITINAPGTLTPHGVALGGATTSVTNDGDGTLNMTGGQITLLTGGVIVGRQGQGALNMSGGAKIDGSAQTLSSAVGFAANGVGVATLTGAGTEWSAGANNMFIGTNSLSGAMTGTGTLSVANGAKVTAANVIVGQGGTLTGNGGTVVGNVTNFGTLAAGASPGMMTIDGNLTLDDIGEVALELGGSLAGQYDHVDVSGIMTLDGTLDVSLYGGYIPTVGSFFDVFTALDIVELTPTFNFAYAESVAWSYEIVTGSGNETLRLRANQAPEPLSLALFGAGLAGIAVLRRRRAGA